ncbi:glutamate--tRNA ligase [Chelativorans sp. YIM 93263]|uniref:glutamate--tRNA ligase n=1 Tax=Chelativorans sp. YIM 93263 TaxID=2906648 RepID=UPI0023799E76|nr:glutamate--tRNA ligase [Chelativorans sp. YIM 93263]
MSVTVRFAPSPTGQIHIGNARTALFNWLFAKKAGGCFILRFDDTDAERSRQAFAEQIVSDLKWLGIAPDMVAYQSERFERYARAVDALKEKGLLYPCYDTPEELERRRRIRLSRRLPPVYGREALKQSKEEKAALEAEGRKPHWRFLLPNHDGDPLAPRRTEVQWDDVVRGPQSVDLASMSDPVLIRGDGTYLYTLPSVVDDIEMGVTHVIRGDDHVTNTGAQIALFEALSAEAPEFGHHNLLTTTTGEGLSKRTGSLSIAGLREDGIEPMAVSSLAVLIGTSEAVSACHDMEELAGHFDPVSSSRSAAKFDPTELRILNRSLVHAMSFSEVAPRLEALGITGPKIEAFWYAVRGNLETVYEARFWWDIVTEGPGEVDLPEEDRQFIQVALNLLPPEPWDRDTWRNWTSQVKADTGRKGKALFKPLRIALTGREAGPDLADLLPLMDREGILARQA